MLNVDTLYTVLAQECTLFNCRSPNRIRNAYYHNIQVVKIDLAVSDGSSGSHHIANRFIFRLLDVKCQQSIQVVNGIHQFYSLNWMCQMCTLEHSTLPSLHCYVYEMCSRCVRQAVKKNRAHTHRTFMTDCKKDSYGYFIKIVDSFLVSISKNKYFIMLKCKRKLYEALAERARSRHHTAHTHSLNYKRNSHPHIWVCL